MKYRYFETEWEDRTDWIENAKSMVQRLWNAEYKPEKTNQPETLLPIVNPIRPQTTNPSSLDTMNNFGTLPDWKRKKRQRLIGDERDELDRYLCRETKDNLHSGPLQYWIDHVDDLRQKNIAQMALDMFTIPALSADPERPFSRYCALFYFSNFNTRTDSRVLSPS